jgi:hypothetical protein
MGLTQRATRSGRASSLSSCACLSMQPSSQVGPRASPALKTVPFPDVGLWLCPHPLTKRGDYKHLPSPSAPSLTLKRGLWWQGPTAANETLVWGTLEVRVAQKLSLHPGQMHGELVAMSPAQVTPGCPELSIFHIREWRHCHILASPWGLFLFLHPTGQSWPQQASPQKVFHRSQRHAQRVCRENGE